MLKEEKHAIELEGRGNSGKDGKGRRGRVGLEDRGSGGCVAAEAMEG